MATTKPTLVGVFDNSSLADNAVHQLEQAGFPANQIYYSSRQTSQGGGFLAGLKNLFTTDETTGTIADDLTNLGLSREEAGYYENEYQAGRSVIALRTNGPDQRALQILQSNGAHTYGTRETARQGYTAGTSTQANAAYTDTNTNPAYADTNDEQQKLRLREEQLNVNKQQVQSGEVHLHKNVISEQQTIDVPVSHEEVYVQRRPVTDQNIDDNTPIGEDEEIRVPVSKEQVNVNKNTVTTGEVTVGKRTVEENQQVSDTVRREEARVERKGDPRVQTDATLNNLENDRLNNDNV